MSVLDILYSTLIMPIQLVFELFFMMAYREIGNPGLSIIVLSLVMNFLVLPLYMRADKMQEHERDMEAKLHAGVAHIRKTFKGDEKMMMLQTYYRQNDYKPTDVFKGSISLFLEIPFFIAAYAYLSHLQLLNGASFGFIRDLGAPDGLLEVGGMAINVLPFVMTAINLATCLLFTKGMPRKTKVQLYGMAALFLVLLYNSPAGLVFYWTLNNVFSLVKTLFYKLKNPKRVLMAIFAIAGAAVLVFGLFFYADPSFKKRALLVALGIVLMLPLVVGLVARRHRDAPGIFGYLESMAASKKTYIAGALLLTVLFGLLIPSAVISASPQEFFNVAHFVNPVWYIVSSLCLAAGTFLVWMSVFYWLTSAKYKPLFQLVLWVCCGIAIMDYLFFGTNMGLLESNLRYQDGLSFSTMDAVVNAAVLVGVAVVLTALFCRLPRKASAVLTVAWIAMVGMGAYNVFIIEQSVSEAAPQVSEYQSGQPSFTLNKDKKNVVVMMLDRAMGEYIPYIINEKPELKEQFSGFTYYENVVSFGGTTNLGAPALFGGYEYTPVEMNKRDDELLEDKHNEALKMMPVLFDENGYDVTVCDPPYAGYQWIPDLSIFDEYEDIHTYITNGRFSDVAFNKAQIDANMRNFFCFSLMKATPLFAQTILYDHGNYNRESVQSESSNQTVSEDGLTAVGQYKAFLDAYSVLQNLDTMTKISDDGNAAGSFVMLTNDTTHEPMLLQEPGYTAAEEVDNREYEADHHDRFTLPEGELKMETPDQYKHYQANVAALQAVGAWLDYLKQNNVYDNTRIIIVADHGRNLDHKPELNEYFYPLLMVKDFDATEFSVSNEFMTNGDVPTLAVEGLIDNATNPFTGKPITNDEKTAHDQYILFSHDWDVSKNNGTTYLPGSWLSVHDDMRDPSNWEEVDDPGAGEK